MRYRLRRSKLRHHPPKYAPVPQWTISAFIRYVTRSLRIKTDRCQITRMETLVKTLRLLSCFLTIVLMIGSAQAQNNNHPNEACPWPANLDGVKAAPETHKVIFENEHVRVLEVTIAPNPYALLAEYALYQANWRHNRPRRERKHSLRLSPAQGKPKAKGAFCAVDPRGAPAFG
jgi:hypothetical protein